TTNILEHYFSFQCLHNNIQHNKKSVGICEAVSARYVLKLFFCKLLYFLYVCFQLYISMLHCFIFTAVYFAAVPDQDRELKIDTNKYPAENGITIELCAGIVDKNIPLEEVARIEVLEECGYDVPVSNLERIISYRSGIGVCGDIQTVFYAEVTDNMKVGKGGGNLEEGEFIELVEMTVAEAKKYLEKDTVRSPGGFLFALLWFFQNKSTI
ncbi:hypothetical protein ANN_22828, partial [Periplaneta americana]